MNLTQDLLRELFDYRDGNLYYKVTRGHVKIGDLAGTVGKDGYRDIMIDYKLYLAHRLIFLWHHEHLPEFLDHIDGNPSNNDINNLREVTLSQNQHNKKKAKFHNGKLPSSIYKGVCRHKAAEKWVSCITIDKKSKHLGSFTSEIAAAKAYNDAAIKAFGKFAKLNKMKEEST